MTRETEMETACPEQQSSVVTAGKKKAVTFDDVRPLLSFVQLLPTYSV